MSSVMNVIPEGPGSVSPRMKHRWTRVRGRAGPSSTQWPGFSAVPWTEGSGFESLGPMYATPRPRTSRYHAIAFRGSETTIAIVSIPTTVIGIGTESEVRGMNLSVGTPRPSVLRGPAPVHFRVPLHDLVVRDPVDLLLDRELVLRLPCLDDPPGGGFPLELGDEELPLPAASLERGHHLGPVEHGVAGPHVELVDDRLAQVEEQVVERRQDKLPVEIRMPDLFETVLHGPHHGSLAPGEEPFDEPSFRHELPQPQAGLPHVVLEPRVGRERLRRCHAEASDDPSEDFPPGVIAADFHVGDQAVPVVRIPGHMETFVQLAKCRCGRRAAQVREDEEPLAGDRSLFLY